MEKPHPLSDLSFFRFPEVTGDVVQNIVLLLILLALAVILAVMLQRRIQERATVTERERALATRVRDPRLGAVGKQVLERLQALAGVRRSHQLLADAERFEEAVETLLATGEPNVPEAVAGLRRHFHMNVMNPNLKLVATRQLLRDLPVRVLGQFGGERLDLYCSLLQVNEEFMLLDLPYQEDVHALLTRFPEVQLIFWREADGETVFRITLEPVPSGEMSIFRAQHVFRAQDVQRKEFRLSVDFPVVYQFVPGEVLARGGQRAEAEHAMRRGEGRLVDLSFSGGALALEAPLAEHGLAQLSFHIHQQPVRMMLEVMSQTRLPGGSWLIRGQFRGMAEQARSLLSQYVSREQVKRLREKEVFRITPGA